MDYKVVVKGINSYGYKFEIPGKMDEICYKNNLNNYRYFIIVDTNFIDRKGKQTSKVISFKSYEESLPLKNDTLYWQEMQFEDGSVLQNRNAHELEEAAHINKLTYEFNHKSKFDDELNKYIGKPILCHKKSGEGTVQNGILLSVDPVKPGINVIRANFGSGTYFMRLTGDNMATVYSDDGNKLEELTTLTEKEVEPAQPENE